MTFKHYANFYPKIIVSVCRLQVDQAAWELLTVGQGEGRAETSFAGLFIQTKALETVL